MNIFGMWNNWQVVDKMLVKKMENVLSSIQIHRSPIRAGRVWTKGKEGKKLGQNEKYPKIKVKKLV